MNTLELLTHEQEHMFTYWVKKVFPIVLADVESTRRFQLYGTMIESAGHVASCEAKQPLIDGHGSLRFG